VLMRMGTKDRRREISWRLGKHVSGVGNLLLLELSLGAESV
jgi:hypothetical protein